MNRIDSTFRRLAGERRKALVAFLSAGDPDYESSLRIMRSACSAGVDVLELGVPFSDPTCDGPVIQRASERALRSGASLERSIRLAGEIRQSHDTAIVIFSYYNLIFRYGLERLAQDLVAAGVDGILPVDCPPEEAEPLSAALADTGIHIIRLAAPTTTRERLEMLVDGAGGFLYLITRTGVTGTGGLDYAAVESHAAEVKGVSPLPVCLGFGISSGSDARRLAPMADGIIVGSALVRLIEEAPEGADLAELVAGKIGELRAGLDGGEVEQQSCST